MERAFRSHEGVTTVELLSAALCAAVVLAALCGFYRQQLFSLLVQETKTATLEDARGALDIMVRELRNAGSWGTGTAPTGCRRVVMATATTIHIQADLNGDGDCDGATSPAETGENVTYALGAATDACPGSNIRRNGNCLVGNVVIPPGQPLFAYYDSGEARLPESPPPDSVKRVKIAFSVRVPEPTPQGKASGKTVTSTLSSSVEIRN